MKERPILFSAPMVRAILAGRKTVTRRLVTVPWKRSVRALPYEPWWVDTDGELFSCDERGDYHPAIEALGSRFGEKGDRLWVRETWAPEPGYEEQHDLPEYEGGGGQPGRIVYAANNKPGVDYGVKRWRPSIFMPRWASRIVLEVVDVRVERLHAITEQDAILEGLELDSFPRDAFAKLWDELNASRAPWADNPWVWRVEFRRVESNA